jgi:hypothetical protein
MMKWPAALPIIGGIWMLATFIGCGEKPIKTANQNSDSVQGDRVREFSRLLASYELARIHVRESFNEVARAALWDTFYRDLRAESQIDASWTVKIIHKTPDRSLALEVLGKEAVEKVNRQEDRLLSEFERRAIDKIEQGEEEVLESPSPGKILYLRSFHPMESCTTVCHAPLPKTMPLPEKALAKEMDLSGMKISLQITFDKRSDRKTGSQ